MVVQSQPASSQDTLAKLVEQIHRENPDRRHLKKLVEKAVRQLPGWERNQIRRELAKKLGFRSWKDLSDNWRRSPT